MNASEHTKFMTIALELAEKGKGYTSPNPVVGAVVVKDEKIVGTGYHEAAGKAHAEVNAIDEAGSHAFGATLYVTLEPCNHYGRTPPCTQRIIGSGIRRVVVAMKDLNPDVAGGGNNVLRDHGIEVIEGICEAEARRLNESFIKFITTKRPFVMLKCAATLDGRIATRTGDSQWVSNEASRRFVHRIRHEVDGIMVGIGTAKADDPRLTTRLDDIDGKDPVRIILDTHLSIPESAKVLHHHSDADTIIVHGQGVSSEKINRLRRPGIRFIESPVADDGIDLNALMLQLGKIPITSLLIEGGSRVIASALKSRIVDKIMIVYAPKITGGDDGIPICKGTGVASMNECIQVKDISVQRFDDDVMISGYVYSLVKLII